MALLSRFDKHYQFKYEVKPVYNKWAEQWAADALVDSYGLTFCYDLLDYYFDVAQKPDWKYFLTSLRKLLTVGPGMNKIRLTVQSEERWLRSG